MRWTKLTMKKQTFFVIAIFFFCSTAYAWVDSNLDAKTTALAQYLQASQDNRINVGVFRLTSTGPDVNPRTCIKQPIMQGHEAVNGHLWGYTTQIPKIIEEYNNGSTIVWISFNPWNPSADCTGDCHYNDKTGSPMTCRKPAGACRATWTGWLDLLAEDITTLNNAGIPVILRLPQEMDGNWFWWGKDNPAADYVEMYQDIVTYLRDTKGLHNILYSFSPDTPVTEAAWIEGPPLDGARYPGDAYVDIIGQSIYVGDYPTFEDTAIRFAELRRASEAHGKIWGVWEGAMDLHSINGNNPVTDNRGWTTYFDFILNNTDARKAAFINFWHASNTSYSRFTQRTDDSYVNFLTVQTDPQYSRFTWGYGKTCTGTRINGVVPKGGTIK
jgi:hypothetical protein